MGIILLISYLLLCLGMNLAEAKNIKKNGKHRIKIKGIS